MFNHILVPLDGSPLAERVIPHVISIAEAFDSRVTLLRVVERPRSGGVRRPVAPLRWQFRLTEARDYLTQLTVRVPELGARATTVLEEGKAAEAIVRYAASSDIDLVVLNSHGQSGLSEWNISSVVQKVVISLSAPSLIIRAYQAPDLNTQSSRYARILAPVDGSQRAECVFPTLSALAKAQDAQVFLAHVVSRPEVPRRTPLNHEEALLVNKLVTLNRAAAADYLAQLSTWLSLHIRTRLLVSDDVPWALHQLVEREKIDLVLLSAHGYTGEPRWPYGRIALNFIVYGTTPLLILQDAPARGQNLTPAQAATLQHIGH